MTSRALTIDSDVRGTVRTVTIDRPTNRNAIDPELLAELLRGFEDLARDPAVRAVVLAGAGGTFCAGADIKAMRSLDDGAVASFLSGGQRLTRLIAELPVPVIAAIEGFALGGGLELALACDLRVAASSAILGLPEVAVGAIPGWGGTQRLVRLVGLGSTFELVLTGRRIPADEALRLGMINEVCAPKGALELACARADEIARVSPAAVRAAKAAIRVGSDLPLAEGLATEANAARRLAGHPDHAEGIEAFIEKRAPRWLAASDRDRTLP